MSYFTGLDIGGTKIGGAVFDEQGSEIARLIEPTPPNYSDFVTTVSRVVAALDEKCGQKANLGVGIPGSIPANTQTVIAANICIEGKHLKSDLEHSTLRPVRIANDANCLALAEAVDGAGKGYNSIFGLIIGTGLGGGFVVNGRLVEGVHGLAGEIGHLPLPYYEDSDGPLVSCYCGQKGCIEKLISGAALGRLYEQMTGDKTEAITIAEMARQNIAEACAVLDRYYTVVAKAMVTILHSFDPEIIVVSGGLSALPGLYEAVPRRLGQYTLPKKPLTKFVPASHGAMAGLRGAAWLWKA